MIPFRLPSVFSSYYKTLKSTHLSSFLVSASQSDAWENEGRKPSTLGAGGESRGETSGHHDDEEKGKVPLRQDHVRKEEKNQRGLFHFVNDLNMDLRVDKTFFSATGTDNLLHF